MPDITLPAHLQAAPVGGALTLALTETDLNHLIGGTFRVIDADGAKILVVGDDSRMRDLLAGQRETWPIQLVVPRADLDRLAVTTGAVAVASVDSRTFHLVSCPDEPDPDDDGSVVVDAWWSEPGRLPVMGECWKEDCCDA